MTLKLEIILFIIYVHYSHFKILRAILPNNTFVAFTYWDQFLYYFIKRYKYDFLRVAFKYPGELSSSQKARTIPNQT